jgi:hypothetical protein
LNMKVLIGFIDATTYFKHERGICMFCALENVVIFC